MDAYNILIDCGPGKGAMGCGAASLEEAQAKAAHYVAFYEGNGHTTVTATISRTCEACNGMGAIRTKRQAAWMPGKPCKACKGAGDFPV